MSLIVCKITSISLQLLRHRTRWGRSLADVLTVLIHADMLMTKELFRNAAVAQQRTCLLIACCAGLVLFG